MTELDDLSNKLHNLSLNSPTGTMASSGNEVILFMPKPFTGKRTELKRFFQDATIYLLVNKEIYNNDQRKVAFVMSFMNEGAAALWKEGFLTKVFKDAEKNDAEPNLGTFSAFKKAVEESFSPYDEPGDALDEMREMRMTTQSSIDEHIAKFKILVTQSGLDRDESPAVMDMFLETLTLTLQRQLLSLSNPPSTLSEWYEKASRFHNYYNKKMQRTFGRRNNATQRQGPQKNEPEKNISFHKPNGSNAMMSMDVLSTDERTALMKKGACFRCKKIGHISKVCPDKIANKR
jgi:hypothetical protein